MLPESTASLALKLFIESLQIRQPRHGPDAAAAHHQRAESSVEAPSGEAFPGVIVHPHPTQEHGTTRKRAQAVSRSLLSGASQQQREGGSWRGHDERGGGD
jgi:hypothetical protein